MVTSDPGALQEESELLDEAYMFMANFRPEAQFRVVSQELEFVPVPEGAGEGHLFASFDTRIIQYEGAQGEFSFFFPYEDASIAQGDLYELGGDWQDIEDDEFGDGDALDFEGGEALGRNVVNVEFYPA